ncbi:hypothetical protein WJX84_008674 [Apatococcus fuscideae]|uniref:Aminomethyltransferase n=1 Tax=Apatococcus fuscideae TaxID=2026836 RepID=A0AAW1T6Q3_9CHLO
MHRQAHKVLSRLASSQGSQAAACDPLSKLSQACLLAPVSRGFASDADLLKTPLYDLHVKEGGKMVPFAGWSMPIQYKDSMMDSVKNCRKNAAMFDVSHMCGLTFKGKNTIPFLEGLVVGDIKSIEDGSGSYSIFTNENGGIIDDTVISKVSDDEVYLVVNAGCREKDLAHLNEQLKKYKDGGVEMIQHDDRSLLALQGPAAMEILQPMTDLDLSKLYFSHFRKIDIKGIPCFLARTGYTGEDGFEISIPNEKAVELAEALMENDKLRLAGLGARDSLRLEAGLCLYGNDLTDETTPVEASLTWTIGKNRRDACDFLGGEIIKKQLADKTPTRRIGFVSSGAPARQHIEIFSNEGERIGEVCSGAFSPTLGQNVAMAYVPRKYTKTGTEFKVEVRGRQQTGFSTPKAGAAAASARFAIAVTAAPWTTNRTNSLQGFLNSQGWNLAPFVHHRHPD